MQEKGAGNFLGRQGELAEREAPPQGGCGLELQLVAGEVLGMEVQHLLQGAFPGLQALIRQVVDQVGAEVVEAGRAGVFQGRPGRLSVVAATQQRQCPVVGRLHADVDAVDA